MVHTDLLPRAKDFDRHIDGQHTKLSVGRLTGLQNNQTIATDEDWQFDRARLAETEGYILTEGPGQVTNWQLVIVTGWQRND